MKYTIAVGTKSSFKLDQLRKVLEDIGLEYELLPVSVESGVSDQPMSSEETQKGALTRAKNALNQSTQADFGVGLEVGYEIKGEVYEMFAWAAVVDHDDTTLVHRSHSFPLPRYHSDILKNRQFLGEYVREWDPEDGTPVKTRLRELIRTREEFIYNAFKYALFLYLLKDEY